MGRGRAKAKQTKVARELKYNSPQTDFDALRKELSGSKPQSGHTHSAADDDEDYFGEYADGDHKY